MKMEKKPVSMTTRVKKMKMGVVKIDGGADGMSTTEVDNYVEIRPSKIMFSVILVMFCKHDQYVADAIF